MTIAEFPHVFHGTSAKHLDAIIKTGLKPRGKSAGVWKENPSAADSVYLTTAYAMHFASASASNHDSTDGLIIDIDPKPLFALEFVLR